MSDTPWWERLWLGHMLSLVFLHTRRLWGEQRDWWEYNCHRDESAHPARDDA